MGWKLTWHCSYPLLKVKVPLMGGRDHKHLLKRIPEHRTLQTCVSHLYALHTQIKPNNDSLFFTFLFNWRIIDLQYCVAFCRTLAWISHRYTYVPSLWRLPPRPTPLGCHRALGWALCVTQRLHTGCLFYIRWHRFQCYPLNSSRPLLPPLCHKCVLYVCVSIAVLQTGSSGPSF